LPVSDQRRDAVLRQLELFRALAEDNEREQKLGSAAHTHPQSLGEWLGTAVLLAGSVSWQAHYALAPLVPCRPIVHPLELNGGS
jgi:hypothetical protein